GNRSGSRLWPHFVIRVDRIVEVVALEMGKACLRYHSACHWLREAQGSEAQTVGLRHRRRHATQHREPVHHWSEWIVGKVLLEAGLTVDVGNHPRPLWLQRFTDRGYHHLRMRHVMQAIER